MFKKDGEEKEGGLLRLSGRYRGIECGVKGGDEVGGKRRGGSEQKKL